MEQNYKKYIVSIHGKDYMTVAGRLRMFWDDVRKSPEKPLEASIMTEVSQNGNTILVKATARVGANLAIGHASEVIGGSNINRTSALENAETSAVGRALGNLGYGLLEAGGLASAEEVQNAIQMQDEAYMADYPVIYVEDEAQKSPKSWNDEQATEKQLGMISFLVNKLNISDDIKLELCKELKIPGGKLSKFHAMKLIKTLKEKEEIAESI